MGFLPSNLTSIGTSFPFLLLIIIIFFFSTFFILIAPSIRKSKNNPSYPPIVATIFHLLFHFDTLFDYQTGLSKTHPTFRVFVTPFHSEVYTVDPRNVEHILKTNFLNYTKGYYNNTILKDLFGEGIFAVDGEKWRQQRKLASFEFSTRVLKDFSCGVFRRKAAKLGEIIKGFCIEKKAFDIQDLLMRCTLDSIFEVGFGVDLNCLGESSEKGKEFIKAFDESNALTYFRYVDFLWKIKRVFNVGSEARLRRNIRVIDDFVLGIIKNKSEKMAHGLDDDEKGICETHKEDILSRFLMERKKEPKSMSDKYLRDIILSFIIAGKDTSANSLSWFFYMLCKHPSVQEKISEQIREVLRDDHTNLNDFVGNLTDATIDKMHYLHAALTETLRLYPVVPIDGKYAEGDDILPDGFKMKKGDGINYVAYAMGRMKSIWGEYAEEFKPERWLEDGIFQPESPFKFTTFHAGPRICLGKEFAYKQMKIVSTVLLRFFRFELREEKEVKYKTMFTLHVEGGLHLRACSRLGLLN